MAILTHEVEEYVPVAGWRLGHRVGLCLSGASSFDRCELRSLGGLLPSTALPPLAASSSLASARFSPATMGLTVSSLFSSLSGLAWWAKDKEVSVASVVCALVDAGQLDPS